MHSLKEKLTVPRLIAYVGGMLILALGIASSIKSNWGCSPVASIPRTVNLIWGLEIGTATTLYQAFLVLVQFLILRKRFSPFTLLQLITGFIFGYLNSLAGWILGFLPAADTLVLKTIYTLVSAPVIALGVWIYSQSDVMNMPSEGVVFTIADVTGQPFHRMKIAFDVTGVVLSCIICLIAVHSFGSIGIGTVYNAITVGLFIGFYTKHFNPQLHKFLDFHRNKKE